MTAVDRRTELLEHARSVIVRDGLATTSLRRISREGGYTTGVLSHWFADKRELIAACFEWTSTTWLERAAGALAAATTPEDSVRVYVDVAIPPSQQQQQEWRLWLEFCGSAIGDPGLAELLVRIDDRFGNVTAEALVRWCDAGLVQLTMSVEEQAAILVRLADGLGLRAIVTGDWAPARRQFVETLRTLGLPDALADEALHPPTIQEAS